MRRVLTLRASSPQPLPVFPYFSLLFLVCLLLLPWGALTPTLFVSVSLFSLSNLISYSVASSPPVPCWPLLSGGYNVGPLTHPIEFLLWECFVRSVSFRGPPSLLHIPHHTRLPGQTSSNLGEAGHECKPACVCAMVQTGGGP